MIRYYLYCKLMYSCILICHILESVCYQLTLSEQISKKKTDNIYHFVSYKTIIEILILLVEYKHLLEELLSKAVYQYTALLNNSSQ